MGRGKETTGDLTTPAPADTVPEEVQPGPKWHIELTYTAIEMLASIKDTRIKKQIGAKITQLGFNPDQLGKPLDGELTGFYSTRAAQQRYRIIYRIDEGKVTVHVVAAAIRREGHKSDVYALAKKLVQAGLIDITDENEAELVEGEVNEEKE
jgi:mRNA interferase RelE/StbE